jgi:hypothetical protein
MSTQNNYVYDYILSVTTLLGVLVYFPTILIILMMAYTNVINFKIALVLAFLFLIFYAIILFSMYRVIQNYFQSL